MFSKLMFMFSVLSVLNFTSGSVNITKCKHDDSKCIKDSAKSLLPYFVDGIQEYGVERVDPLFLKYVDASSTTLKFILNDVTVTGLKDCNVNKIERNVTKSTIMIKTSCSGHMQGQYEMKGRLIILPIEGKGKIIVTLRKSIIKVILDIKNITKDGKQYWDIKHWTHSYELKEKSDLVFENLFNGNELLGRAARQLISSNANDIILEIGSPVIKALVERIVGNVNNMFHGIPADDLTLN